MAAVDEFLEANERYAATFDSGALQVRPRRALAVLTCMDSRYTAQGVLGLALGDAHVIRNAGGRVTDDAIRSLVLSSAALGTRGCVVIHHTNCGLLGTTNEAIAERVEELTGARPEFDFLPFDDIEASVRVDLAALRESPYLPADYAVLGFVYDVETGRLRHIEG